MIYFLLLPVASPNCCEASSGKQFVFSSPDELENSFIHQWQQYVQALREQNDASSTMRHTTDLTNSSNLVTVTGLLDGYKDAQRAGPTRWWPSSSACRSHPQHTHRLKIYFCISVNQTCAIIVRNEHFVVGVPTNGIEIGIVVCWFVNGEPLQMLLSS